MSGRSQGIGGRASALVAVAVAVVASGCGAGLGALGSPATTAVVGSAPGTTTEAGGTTGSGDTNGAAGTTGSAGTTGGAGSGTTTGPGTTTGSAAGGVQPPGSCHARGSGPYVLPDPNCTPGALNPAVTQADIRSTICTPGWTRTVRPPESYSEPLKYRQLRAYGDTGPVRDYEEDHLVPLELGGSPTDARNLWPEPGGSPNPKDAVENAARRAVCDGRITLAAARQAMASDWVTLGRQLGVK